MEKHLCSGCEREFQSAESLEQHKQAKHSAQPAAAPKKKKSRKGLIIVAVLAVAVVLAYFVVAGRNSGDGEKPLITGGGNGEKPLIGGSGGGAADNFDEKAFAARIPKGAIHWHPHVTLLIKGKSTVIPANIGLGGTVHQPVHTHETDNILHWEVNNPTVENMQLGYFFNTVWKKEFSSECVLDYCSGPEGTVKMYVNEVENTEFDHYMPKDLDEIKIVFE